jgi:hypothetical protein
MRTHDLLIAMRRAGWLGATAWAAAALVAISAWIPRHGAGNVVPTEAVPASAEQLAIESDIQRFALNALLVPLLDHEASPMRWADPSLAMSCDGDTRVHVNGRPLEPGTPVAGRAFGVVWTLHGCFPFGAGGPELTGRASLEVSRDPDGLSAMVRLSDLTARRDGHSVVMNTAFVARTR